MGEVAEHHAGRRPAHDAGPGDRRASRQTEPGEGDVLGDLVEDHRDALTDLQLVVRDADDVGDDPHALVEVDHGDVVGHLAGEPGVEHLVDPGERVDGAVAGRGLPAQRVAEALDAPEAHRPHPGAARAAVLEHELASEDAVEERLAVGVGDRDRLAVPELVVEAGDPLAYVVLHRASSRGSGGVGRQDRRRVVVEVAAVAADEHEVVLRHLAERRPGRGPGSRPRTAA